MIKRTVKHTQWGSFHGFKRLDRTPRSNPRRLNAFLLTLHQAHDPAKGCGTAAVQLVAVNNYMRRFLYWIGAPRWMRQSV